MSKGGVIVLIVSALVFCGLGFVIGQVVQATVSTPGSSDDPLVSQSYVDKIVGEKTLDLQEEIDDLKAQLSGSQTSANNNGNTTAGNNDNTTSNNTSSSTKTVKVNTNSLNIRSSASTSANIVGSASSGTVLTYLDKTTASDNKVWYKIKTAAGVEGWVAGWLCTDPA